MIFDIDVYDHPETSAFLKDELSLLNEQIRIVEGLEHARARLLAKSSLEYNTLSKCDVFMRYANESTPGSNFDLEIRKLSLDELAFCSISFEDRRLKHVVHHFKAANIRKYMTTTHVSCLERQEIFRRLNRLCAESEGKPFKEIYSSAYMVYNNFLAKGSMESNEMDVDPEPATMAKQPGSFEFPTARWSNIDKVFPAQAANAIRHAPQRIADPEITDCVRSRFPRGRSEGDAIVWLDIGSNGALPFLPTYRSGIEMEQVRAIFGDAIYDAVDESDLRKWEKRNGRLSTTECVKMKVFCHMELRIGYDTTIAKKLFN
ncbi:hypothetical protein MPDQ_002657 [Monascus purpureus]|uniref:Uncharacterized protein n=1 Tax=Monascus purpureus TaxID=5098 RepID=A0A507QP54_MONPU|nr:hypothetical protein MPDQ_002657 [Monascus purpureus]